VRYGYCGRDWHRGAGADRLRSALIPEGRLLCRICGAPHDGDIGDDHMTGTDVSTDYLWTQPMAGIR